MPFNEYVLLLDPTARSLAAGLIILVLLLVESRLMHLEGSHSPRRLLLHRIIVMFVYFAGVGAALHLTGTITLILGTGGGRPWAAIAVQLFLIWITAKFIVHNFSGMFEKIDKRITSIDLTQHEHMLIKKAFKYAVYFFALTVSLQALGLVAPLTALLAGAGFAGIVIGFAAKDVLANFFAGISLVADKPYRIGDFIQVTGTDVLGTVKEISLRSTEILRLDNSILTVPNSLLATSVIVNYTRNKQRRLIFPIGIAYEADVRKATEAIKRALPELPFVIKPEEIFVFITGFGQSSLDMEIWVWVDTNKAGWGEIRTNSMAAVKEELQKSKVEIAYPKRVVITKTKP